MSAAFLGLLTWAILDSAFGATRFGEFLMHVQIVPAILSGTVTWLVLWVLITLIFGRVYCSSVCPLGTVQDIGAHLGRRLSRGSAKRYRYMPPQTALRIAVPTIVGACLILGITAAVEATDPYSVYRKLILAICRPTAIAVGSLLLAIAALLIISAVAWSKGRLICNTVCPAGGLLGLLARQPVYRVDINTDKCIHCGKCEDVCKSSCVDLRDCVVDNSRCVMCFDCTAVCPNDAITVRRGKHTLSIPMMQRINKAQATIGPLKTQNCKLQTEQCDNI